MTHMAGVCLVPGLDAPPGLLLLLPPVSEGEEDHQQEDAEEDEDEGGHAHHQQVQVRLVEVGDGLRDEDGGVALGPPGPSPRALAQRHAAVGPRPRSGNERKYFIDIGALPAPASTTADIGGSVRCREKEVKPDDCCHTLLFSKIRVDVKCLPSCKVLLVKVC